MVAAFFVDRLKPVAVHQTGHFNLTWCSMLETVQKDGTMSMFSSLQSPGIVPELLFLFIFTWKTFSIHLFALCQGTGIL